MGSQYWQVASVAGKVPKLVKVSERKHRAIARCEVCGSIYIIYISVSQSTPSAVTGPHGQLASVGITVGPYILSHASEMGSPSNPPWALGSDKTKGQGSFGP